MCLGSRLYVDFTLLHIVSCAENLFSEKIDMYTNLAAAGSGKGRQEQAPKPESSRFVNPYVNTRPTKPRPNAMARSVSETVLPTTSATASSSQPQIGSTLTRPSAPTSRALATTGTQKRVDSDYQPDSRPAGSSSSRHRARSRANAARPKSLPPNPNPPPGPDSTWIHKSLALKMKFTDFQPGEYIVREDWHGAMKFPENLDPPNGLDTLRCLFCEKQYSGVNARSMWRRHVSQKHDVILAGAKTMGAAAPRVRSRKSTKSFKPCKTINSLYAPSPHADQYL